MWGSDLLVLEPLPIISAPGRLGTFPGNPAHSAVPGVYHTLHFVTSEMLLIMTLLFFKYLEKKKKMLPIMSVEARQ